VSDESKPSEIDPQPLADDGERHVPPESGWTRRVFLEASLGGFAAATVATRTPTATALRRAASPAAGTVSVVLRVNGVEHHLNVDPRVTLLEALRENLALSGTKEGCDHGQCGACTVLVDGRRVLSCMTLTVAAGGREVTTVEGLAKNGQLHPVQAAFLEEDGFQCGYCTPGQIMSAVGLIAEGCPGDDAGIRECMSGNICRCGAYPNIVAAVRRARDAAGGKAPA
jgi:xanthine dehydrogenase YagT iron-sulfur-binding subunit